MTAAPFTSLEPIPFAERHGFQFLYRLPMIVLIDIWYWTTHITSESYRSVSSKLISNGSLFLFLPRVTG